MKTQKTWMNNSNETAVRTVSLGGGGLAGELPAGVEVVEEGILQGPLVQQEGASHRSPGEGPHCQ